MEIAQWGTEQDTQSYPEVRSRTHKECCITLGNLVLHTQTHKNTHLTPVILLCFYELFVYLVQHITSSYKGRDGNDASAYDVRASAMLLLRNVRS